MKKAKWYHNQNPKVSRVISCVFGELNVWLSYKLKLDYGVAD